MQGGMTQWPYQTRNINRTDYSLLQQQRGVLFVANVSAYHPIFIYRSKVQACGHVFMVFPTGTCRMATDVPSLFDTT